MNWMKIFGHLKTLEIKLALDGWFYSKIDMGLQAFGDTGEADLNVLQCD